jgi:tetratricopeptide (TPR) repeat protein
MNIHFNSIMGRSSHKGKEMFQETIKDLSRAINVNPDNFENYHYRGLAFFIIDQYDKAIDDLKKSLNLHPSDKVSIDILNLINERKLK